MIWRKANYLQSYK